MMFEGLNLEASAGDALTQLKFCLLLVRLHRIRSGSEITPDMVKIIITNRFKSIPCHSRGMAIL
jgi:hypothetical protein